jgi:hypothetical protein
MEVEGMAPETGDVVLFGPLSSRTFAPSDNGAAAGF